MHKPTRITATPIFVQPFTVQPKPYASLILDLEVVAQTRPGAVFPPFWCDPFGPSIAGNAVHLTSPDELRWWAFWYGIDHAHFFGGR
jgi:hypothetical protein